MKHTPEPWEAHGSTIQNPEGNFLFVVVDSTLNGVAITGQEQEANTERVVECVNALTGVEDPKRMRETWDIVKELELDQYHKLKKEHDDFKKLVAKMRFMQKEFFKYRAKTALTESKRLEIEVDRLTGEQSFLQFID